MSITNSWSVICIALPYNTGKKKVFKKLLIIIWKLVDKIVLIVTPELYAIIMF